MFKKNFHLNRSLETSKIKQINNEIDRPLALLFTLALI